MEKIRWKIYRSDSMYVKLIFLRKISTETENKTKIKYWIMDTDTCLIHWLDAKDIRGKTEREGVREPITVMTKDKLEYSLPSDSCLHPF